MTAIDNLIIGEDGRIYFHYNKGMTFTLIQKNGEVHKFKIEDCFLKNDKEYYLIRRDCDDFITTNSLRRMQFWLGTQLLEITEEGERVELPLLLQEVKVFFAVQASQRKDRKAEIVEKLKRTRYSEVKKELKKIQVPLIFLEAAANGENPSQVDVDRYNELKAENDKLTAELNAILKACGFSDTDFKIFEVCDKCDGYGIIDGKICDCAANQTKQIKQFNAAQRLLNKTKEVI